MTNRGERGKGISLARGIAFGFQEGLEQLRRIGHQNLVVLVDGGNGKDGVLANVGVAVLETGSRRRKQGFYELGVA